MKKRPLYLALSATVALCRLTYYKPVPRPHRPQSGRNCPELAHRGSRQEPGSVWSRRHTCGYVAVKKAPSGGYTAHDIAASSMNGQVVLFLGRSGKDSGVQGSQAPAAALTIHTSLPETTNVAAVEAAPVAAPMLVAMNPSHDVVSDATPASAPAASDSNNGSNKELLAQLAPDQLVAQASDAGANVTPIPPVVSGTVDLEEFKPSNAIELKVSQSRTFKLRNKVIRTSISDPSIAEPVVVAENQLVLLGKAPGTATMVIWDDPGNSVAWM